MIEFDGILCIDKPSGMTSFDVVAKLRGIARMKRIGHAGTLDPIATGVLPVFFGRAAKAIDLMPDHDKTYLAELELGITTDTQDITGTILERKPFDVTRESFLSALESFTGELEQLPPMYSAARVNGRRLYDYARNGIEVERKPRKITVYSAELAGCGENAGSYTIRVSCSRGTYIRTICHDLGQALDCGATMTALRREKACGFTIEDCVTLEDARRLSDAGTLRDHILPVSSLFSRLPRLVLTQDQAARFCTGLQFRLPQLDIPPGQTGNMGVYGPQGRFLGVASPDLQSGLLIIRKLFALGESL